MAAGDLLRNAESKPIPQVFKSGSTYTPAEGDTTELEIYKGEHQLRESENFIGYTGQKHAIVNTSFSRPADTTQYATGDAVSNSTSAPTILTLAAVVRSNEASGRITRARLIKSDAGVTSASFRLWFFSEAVTPTNDNSALSMLEADLSKVIGYVDLTLIAMTDYAQLWTSCDMPFDCPAGADDIFCLVEARDAYTPASAETFTVEVTVEHR